MNVQVCMTLVEFFDSCTNDRILRTKLIQYMKKKLGQHTAIATQKPMPVFDSFAVITIVLATIVVVGSFYFYKRSKRELKKTLELL